MTNFNTEKSLNQDKEQKEGGKIDESKGQLQNTLQALGDDDNKILEQN